MIAQTGTEWQPRAQQLADLLAEKGDLHEPAWAAAIAGIPRHVFVPEVYEQDQYGTWNPVEVTMPSGLDRVYSPITLTTALANRGTHYEGISSSTKPDLMVRMLETLDVHDGHRVLEIGTGTGYNAALLTHRLGDDAVFSVDLDGELVDPARERLASIGLHPTLVTQDGAEGLPEHAPYDRIMSTCSVPAVPTSWQNQLADGGLVLVDVKVATDAGNLVLLRKDGDRLEGRFTDRWGAFMVMRHQDTHPRALHTPIDAEAHTRVTRTPPSPWKNNRVVWFLAHLAGLPRGMRHGMRFDPDTQEPTATTITAPDGSHAFVMTEPTPDGAWSVTEQGPTSLWAVVERAHEQWERHDRPHWSRLGLTVTEDGQNRVWVDDPDNEVGWKLREDDE